MMRLLRFLLLFALLAYGLWPYYSVFRLDTALGHDDPAELQNLVDLQAIQQNYKRRFNAGLGGLLPPDSDPDQDQPFVRGLAQGLDRLGSAAIDQYITLPWVAETLRGATRAATNQNPAYLISGISFAFFESYDRFLIRIGRLGEGAVHVRMRLEGTDWRVTDIVR
ncbi:Protein of unknown function (DUF2939) [Thioflavicoccus mobilis 8321]|uniref:DUF2939 domain-containing protein n=1 Tax=Thioflavicoccus mobilis 8321 TaxID=765912 RepID=L0GZ92_9GAMM|nr:Protein of unknown function (DUF2939) [Thioflavicoccus mobilis 8321]